MLDILVFTAVISSAYVAIAFLVLYPFYWVAKKLYKILQNYGS